MEITKRAQRRRKPLRDKLEAILTKELETILIRNYKADNKTTRFDFKHIK